LILDKSFPLSNAKLEKDSSVATIPQLKVGIYRQLSTEMNFLWMADGIEDRISSNGIGAEYHIMSSSHFVKEIPVPINTVLESLVVTPRL
jgi:hypothetical protein